MGGLWTGEAIGFTEFLSDLPEKVSNAMLKALGLPLERGMSSQTVQAAIGEPGNVQSFAADRLTYEYRWVAVMVTTSAAPSTKVTACRMLWSSEKTIGAL
jgi:hypothetical protein